MKINPNVNTNLPEVEKTPASPAPIPIAFPEKDQLEASGAQFLFGDGSVRGVRQDFASGGLLLTGATAVGFGLDLPAVQLAPPEAPAASEEDGFWEGLSSFTGKAFGFANDVTSPVGDAIDWVVEGIFDARVEIGEGLDWLGGEIWESAKQLPDALEAGGSFLKNAAETVGEGLWDGAWWTANTMSEGFFGGLSAIAEGMQEASEAVGDFVGDAVDAVGDFVGDVFSW